MGPIPNDNVRRKRNMMQTVLRSFSSAFRRSAVALTLGLWTLSAGAAIEPVAGGYLFTGAGHSVLISETNGSIVSMTTGGGSIAASGEAGLWSVAFITNSGSSSLTGDLNAAAFSAGSPTDAFTATLAPSSNLLFLTYSNADITVEITASNRVDGIDFSAEVTPRATNVYALTLPAPMRFVPESIDRFIAPNHSSDGVGMAFNKTYFELQDPDSPASWSDAIVGPGGYISLYGGALDFGTNNDPVSLTFTTNGVAWLGTALSNKWSSATAIVNRAPAAGQADVVLIDSPEGAFLSGSKLGGGAGAGYLMRIGGPIRAAEVDLSLDVVIGALEHLAQTPGGRTNIAMLSLVRGPVVGENWPSEVRLDQWRARFEASGVLGGSGFNYVELANMPEIHAALADTNYFAILNPYGELLPVSLTGGVSATVSAIGDFVDAGGTWFEVAGYPFFQTLEPYLYYTNNIFYPPIFADFFQVETTNGHASIYGVQPLSTDPWAGETNEAAIFVPGRLIWGADTNGGWLQRSFATYVETNQTWTSPAVRMSFGLTAEEALDDYGAANAFTRDLDGKMTPDILSRFRQSVMIHFKGDATQMTARLDDLPAPALLHFEEYLQGGFDKEYPDHLNPADDPPSPNPVFGTPAEFTNFLGEARARGHLTMPYTNPTFWGVDPKGPTWDALGNDDPLLRNLDGSINFEAYFGEGGFTVTPWHPEVQAANRNTRGQFITNYPVDLLFQDQLGARTWQYDINPESPTPYAYLDGLLNIAREDSASIPLSTENGYDRLINSEAQFAGLAWGLAPTTNAPFWRRYLRERYAPSTWEIFPLAQRLAHDKVGFIYNNLDAAVHNHEVMAWTLGLGYGMTDVLFVEELDDNELVQWLYWIDRIQKSVVSRYVGKGVVAFDHHWGTDPVNPDNGVIAAQYGPVSVVGNLGPDAFATNGWTLPGRGYVATDTGLVAGHLVPPGESTPEAFVTETNGATEVRFWIHSVGSRDAKIVLPAGYTGIASVQVGTNAPADSEVTNGVLTVTLPASADEILWSGTATFAVQPDEVFLIDFGRHDSGTNGDTTASPDVNGNYWNNIGPTTQAVSNGTRIVDMVNITNGTSGVGIEMITAGWEANGIINGGLLAPSTALLGDLAITNATKDYFFTTVSPSFRISGLDTGSTYNLTFFGTRETTTTRITTYTVGAVSTNLQTSGAAIGDGGYDGNNNKTATLANLSPNASGNIDVGLSVNTGGFAYLGILKIEAFAPEPPAITVTTQDVILVDFGNDSSFGGASVANPDGNGNYWNSIWSGAFTSNLINVSNAVTTVDIGFDAAQGTGNFNGPAGQVVPAALGLLGGDTNAVNDYYISSKFQIQGLDTGLTYRLTFFGSHKYSPNTSTVYSVCTDANYDTVVASVSLDVQVPGSPALHNSNQVAVLDNLAPQPNGRLYVSFAGDAGTNGYLNAMMIEALDVEVPAQPQPATTQAVYRIDFGRHDGGVNGTATASPDTNGKYWNNLGPTTVDVALGTRIDNLVDTTNGASTIDLEILTSSWDCNGKLNGGLLSPSPALLGEFAIATATEDYFFTQGSDRFKLEGLDPDRRYNLRLFGTRSNTSTRITTYAAAFASTNLQTSGTGIGDGGYNGNNDTIAVLPGIAPTPAGEIEVTVSVDTGGFAYLGILEIEEYIPALSTNPGPAILASPASLSFVATNGAPSPAAQTFGLTNSGIGTLNFQLATNANWLSVSPVSGSLSAGAGQTITVSVDTTGLGVGLYDALILISDPAATNDPRYVTVSLQVKPEGPLLAVFGSSVAKGWNSSGQFADPDVFVEGGSWSNGYTALMTLLLQAQGGPTVTNAATPGDNTAAGLSKFPTRIQPLSPTYCLLAFSLGNEGLAGSTDPTSSNIVATFSANLWNLVGLCRSNGIYPVISSVYPHGGYTLDNYAYLKQMHLTINAWDVPSLNLMTPLDNGAGQWMNGYWTDAAHPNDAGYAEFFYAFVPSLFDAIAAGRTNSPAFGSATNFARLTASPGVNDPLVFTPSNTMHSFTMAFRMRTSATGTVAAVKSGVAWSTLDVRAGQLVYTDRVGAETAIATNLADGAWRDIALSSWYARSNTFVYIDGVQVASIPEQYAPDQFVLGGPGASGRAATPAVVDLDSWCVYRAGWTPDEAMAHRNGALQQSSMEIGAMLDDASFVNGSPAANEAQSLSEAVVNTDALAAWTSEPAGAPTLLIYGSSVAQGYHGPGSPGYTNGSFALGYGGRLTPVLEESGWTVTNASVGGNSTADALARFDTDAIPVDPDVILIGLSLGNEGLLSNPDSDAVYESFRSGMTNLIGRSRTNGFYPAVTLVYPNGFYDAGDYGYVKRMNLLMNSWDVPSVNFLGAIDDGTGKWVDGYWNDSAHPNPTGYREMYAAIVPSLFDAIQLGKTGTPALAGTTGFARLQNAGSQPITFSPDSTVLGYNASFRVRSEQTGTVAAVLSSTGSATVVSPATFLIDFGRHDGGTNGNATASPDANGNHWNNLSPDNPAANNAFLVGNGIANLVTVSNAATAVGLELTSLGWYANGIQNGGLLAPSNTLLGDLAIASATEDYMYVGGSATFKLTGLNPDSAYTLRFFGSRDSTETRTTIFAVATNATALTTSGTGIGTYAPNQNDDTVAELTAMVPEANGDLEVLVIRSEGSYAHLNLMEVIEIPGPAQATGGTIELRDGEVAYVAEGGGEITAPVDGIGGGWIDIALSYSSVRQLTLLYVDGVFAGSLGEVQRPMQFVLGGPGALANAAPAPGTFDLQDWCVYRAPWTPDEALAHHTGALQQASMEIGAPLADVSFPQGGTATNLAQSLSLAFIEGTNLTAGAAVTPPGNLQAGSPTYNTVNLTWTDNSPTESGVVVERRPADGTAYWSNLVTLAANSTGYVDTEVPGGDYAYRVATVEGTLLSDYSGVASVSVADAPYADPSVTYREWASGYFALAPEGIWIDFNTNTMADYGGQIWNTVTSLSDPAAHGLVNTDGDNAGYTLAVTDDFSDFRSGNGAPLPVFDADAQGSYFGINAAGAQVVLSNLNRNARFDALIFARRGLQVPGFDYRTVFTFTGSGDATVFEIDTASNTAPVRVFNLKPDGVRTLTLDVDSPASPTGTVFGGINLLVLDERNGPGPYLVDFNTSAGPSYPFGETWNTVDSLTDSTPYALSDIDGDTSAGYTLTLDDGFDQFRADNGDLVSGFPAAAESTCFALRDDVPLTAQMTFAGLDTNLLYDITFLARRGSLVGGFDYGGTYTFAGAATNVVVVESATNTAYTDVTGLVPDSAGRIALTVAAGPGTGTDFPVINALRLSSGGAAAGPAAASGPNDNPDGDEMANLVEFGQNQDPLAAGASTFELYDVANLLASSAFEAYYRRNAQAVQLAYPVESSTNLNTEVWGPDATVSQSVVDDDGTNQTVRLQWPHNGGDLFIRVRTEFSP